MATRDGCKLPRHLENPLDDLIMAAVEPALRPLRDAGVTPNAVTLASAAATAGSVYCCFRGKTGPAMALWAAGYVLDCVDGFMARRFGMETVLGDALDHGTDLLGYAGLAAFVLSRLYRASPRVVWPVAVELLLCAAALYHMNCQEKGTEHLAVKGVGGCACMSKNHLRWSRWGGLGTLMAWHVFLIYFYRIHS